MRVGKHKDMHATVLVVFRSKTSTYIQLIVLVNSYTTMQAVDWLVNAMSEWQMDKLAPANGHNDALVEGGLLRDTVDDTNDPLSVGLLGVLEVFPDISIVFALQILRDEDEAVDEALARIAAMDGRYPSEDITETASHANHLNANNKEH